MPDLGSGGALMDPSIHGVNEMWWLAGTATDIDRAENPVAEVAIYIGRLAHDEEQMNIDYSNHKRNLRAFLDSLESDNPYLLDGREARKTVEIIEAVYDSADMGGPVCLG